MPRCCLSLRAPVPVNRGAGRRTRSAAYRSRPFAVLRREIKATGCLIPHGASLFDRMCTGRTRQAGSRATLAHNPSRTERTRRRAQDPTHLCRPRVTPKISLLRQHTAPMSHGPPHHDSRTFGSQLIRGRRPYPSRAGAFSLVTSLPRSRTRFPRRRAESPPLPLSLFRPTYCGPPPGANYSARLCHRAHQSRPPASGTDAAKHSQ